MTRVLIVDDEESICWGLERICQSLGHQTTACASAEAGLEAVRDCDHDLIILDVRLPGMNGLEAMQAFSDLAEGVPIIVITAYGELDSAVAAIQNGAFEYLPKPFDGDRVRTVIEKALAQAAVPPATAPAPTEPQRKLGDIVGSCPRIQEVFRRIAFAATSNASVLINGESGTGKELAARAIHRYSNRADAPFVAVNVAALSPTLAESELFGHVKSAFTGADRDRTGLLVQANEGTLFLDEIAEIPLSLQVKLLRCLDQGEVLPIGSNQPVKTNFRIISATHQDLPQAVAAGTFRHDLFFRICAFQINLPALREREDDAIELAEFFVRELSRESPSTSPPPRLSESARQEIRRREWTGNVRELRNAIEHALILSRGNEILAEHLPESVHRPPAETAEEREDDLSTRIRQLLRTWTEQRIKKIQTTDPDCQDLHEQFLKLLEPEFLSTVMQHFDNQYVAAAKVLGIHRTTLKKKLVDHGADKDSTFSV